MTITSTHEFGNYIDSLDIPILNLGDKIGRTDYIDFIMQSDFDSSIVKGVDIYQRPFLVIKVVDNTHKVYMETFFQRYTGNNSLWMGAGISQFIDTIGGMSVRQMNLVLDLINGKTCITEDYQDIGFIYRPVMMRTIRKL